MTITKNRQSEETISSMAKMAYPDKQIAEIKELTEGMCNVTYDVAFKDGSESILKIAAKEHYGGNHLWMTDSEYITEVNIFWKALVRLRSRKMN